MYTGSTKKNEEKTDRVVLALKNAGLLSDPRWLIGRTYRFEGKTEPCREILIGTVIAIEISNSGVLDLCVSSPRFSGLHLTSIRRDMQKGEWVAITTIQGLDTGRYPGTITWM